MSETQNDILVHTEAGVTTITLNRVDKKNSLTRAMYTTLAETLAGIATYQQVCCREMLNFGYILDLVVGLRMVGQVHIARVRQDIVGHDHFESCSKNSSVRATATGKK